VVLRLKRQSFKVNYPNSVYASKSGHGSTTVLSLRELDSRPEILVGCDLLRYGQCSHSTWYQGPARTADMKKQHAASSAGVGGDRPTKNNCMLQAAPLHPRHLYFQSFFTLMFLSLSFFITCGSSTDSARRHVCQQG
jgi:hypothetical protein